jgi:hypothetical protein
MRFPADHVESFAFVDFNMKLASDFKGVIGVGIRSASSALDHDFSRLKFTFNELRLCFFGQVEILAESFEAVEPIVHADGNGSGAFHWHVANAEQSQ